jgi:hypothetical protein
MKTIQFINIQNGICLIKGAKNQNACVTVFCIKLRVWIPLAVSAIYGQMTKLKTVMGINNMKYNFSVVARVLKVTWILPQAYISRINPANNSNTNVNCPAERKLEYFAYVIHKNAEVGCADNHKTHWWIKFPNAKAVIPAK